MSPTIIHDISFNHPHHSRPFTTLEKRIEIYVILQQEICYDHRDQPSYQTIYDDAKEVFKTLTPQKLKRGVDLRLAPLMFELCLRSLAESLPEDIGCPMDPMDIMRYLGEMGDMPNNRHVYSTNPILRLRALAALAWIFFRQYFWSPYPDCFEAIDASAVLKQCVFHSEVLAVSDFLPPIVLRIAGWLSTVQVRYAKFDARVIDDDFRSVKKFWTAYEGYLERQKMEEQKRLAKVAKAPNQYRCAADGCGIQALNKCALRKCGGDCPPDKKPHYCSVECQAQHWFIHRSVCKGVQYTDIVDDDGDPAWEDGEVYRPRGSRLALDARAPWADREGPEIFIDIPNISRYRKEEVFRLRTKTMSPAFLKSYKALWRERSLRVRQRLQRDLLPWPDAIPYPPCDHGDELVKTEFGCTCTCGSEDCE